MAQRKVKLVGKKASPTGFRPTPRLRSALEKMSKENGRSLSQEIESRLETSFHAEREYGGAQQQALFRALAAVASVIEERTGKRWIEDWWTAVAVSTAWRDLVREFRPGPDKVLEPNFAPIPTAPQAPDLEFPKMPPHGLLRKATREESSDYEQRAEQYSQAMIRFEVEVADCLRKLADREEQIRLYAENVAEHAKIFTDLGSEAARSIFPRAEQETR